MRSTAERAAQPVTYESALAWARGFATDADALHEVVHAGFNADETSGGYAFLEPGGTLYVASRNGSVMFSRADVDPAPAIEQFWAEQRHRDRPICGLPALGGPRYPRAVCNACSTRAADSTGRLIAGYNTSLSGGFVACYLNDDGTAGEVCAEVTARGECWIDGRPCSIGEARFGGVVIQAT